MGSLETAFWTGMEGGNDEGCRDVFLKLVAPPPRGNSVPFRVAGGWLRPNPQLPLLRLKSR